MEIVFIVFVILLLSGMPVAFSIAISGFLFFLQNPNLPITIPIQLAISQTQNFALLAVPMFILAGNLMNGAGITKRLLDLSYIFTGRMRGGTAQVSAVLSTMMGGVSGSCIGDAVMETRMLGPEMIKRGYSKGFSVAVNVWTSLIVTTIPPGIGLILYGTVGQVSIGRLFAGGIIPGVVLLIAFMVTISIMARVRGYQPERTTKLQFKQVAVSLGKSSWALVFPFLLLTSLRLGIFTPSEVGSFAVVYALFVGFFIYRELGWKKLQDVTHSSTGDIGSAMFLIALSAIMGYGIIWDRLPETIANFLLSFSSNPHIILIIIMFFLVLAGMIIDGAVLILMLTPIFLPIAEKIGFDPVHFGLVFVMTITLGNFTPPVGAAIYPCCSILDCSLQEYVKESLVFLLASLVAITLLVFIPDIVLFLPNLIFGK